MTIGGALSELNNLLEADDIPIYYKPSIKAVIDTITLEQQTCENCISRQAVLEYIEGSEAELGHSSENELVCQYFKELPPVTPQPKTGHWIMTNDYYTGAYGTIDYVKCSCCGEESLEEGDFCPNCGRRMVEPQESEDKE